MKRCALLLSLLASGCAYKVALTTTPNTATVQLPGEQGTVVDDRAELVTGDTK